MSLVGDVIQGFRELAPDPSQTLQPPTFVGSTNTTPPAKFTGGSTIYLRATQGTQWGETAGAVESSVTNASPFNISATVTCSYLATYVRVYFGVAGGEDQYVEQQISTPTNSVTVTINTLSTIGQSLVPTISRAFLPDTDGNVTSATLLYRWLNDGLKLAGQISGGIRDVTGFPSTIGQAQYQIIGLWTKFDNNFYDGYPFPGGGKSEVFRHSSVTGLTGVGTCNVSADRQLVELWPQPNRTSGTATLSAPITATATTLPVSAVNGWVLPFGLLLLGAYPPTSPSSCELAYYSNLASSSITEITRGMGGTQPQAWPTSTPIMEVNAYLTGLRFPQIYSRGQSAYTFTCPPGWEDTLITYMTSRFKRFEQDLQGADADYKRFLSMCENIKNSRQPMGPRRIQAPIYGGGTGIETVVGAGSVFGGVIIQ